MINADEITHEASRHLRLLSHRAWKASSPGMPSPRSSWAKALLDLLVQLRSSPLLQDGLLMEKAQALANDLLGGVIASTVYLCADELFDIS